jgi:parvulin-like peptidyl-prolyl isomerase
LSPSRILLAALFALIVPALAQAQQHRDARPAAPTAPAGIQLSADDVSLVVEGLDLPPEAVSKLAGDAGERKRFAHDLRQMLAASEEARSLGYAARPELKLQLELARSFAVAQIYFKRKRQAGAASNEQILPQGEIDALLKEPAEQQEFADFLEDYRKNGPNRGAPITDEQRQQLAQHYGRVMLAMRKGTAEGIARERGTQLAVMLQQARLLAGAYAKEAQPRIKATDAETDAFIAAHPEYDTKVSRQKAEDILKRVQAGEDFAALAKEFSEDPGSRAQGGDLGWFGRGVMVKEFEDAAFALKQGEVSGVVESPFGYHIIKLEERRRQMNDANNVVEEVHARHILVLYSHAPRDPNSPPTPPREQARAAVEEEKRERLFDDLAARHNVRVAEDYKVGPGNNAPASPSGGSNGAGGAAPAAQTQKPAGAQAQTQTKAQGRPPATTKTPARRAPARRGN